MMPRAWQEGTRVCLVLKKVLTWQGSRRVEVSSRFSDCMSCHVTCLTRRDPECSVFGDSFFDKAGQPKQSSLFKKGWLLVLRCLVLDKKDPGMFSVRIMFSRQGSRREESSSWSVGCLSCCFSCLTRRNSGIFSVRMQFRQDRAADGKKPRLELLIAFLVVPRAWQELTR